MRRTQIPTAPRLVPVPPAQRDDEARELLALVPVDPAPNIYATLVRHPGLLRRWWPFTAKLLTGKLPARDREILILRTGYRCNSQYEWGQHAPLAREAGLTDDDLQRLQVGPDAPGWSSFDAALVRAADELHDQAVISDDTWAQLAVRYDERQLIEVPMVVGQYHLVAFTLNSLGVPLDPGISGFET